MSVGSSKTKAIDTCPKLAEWPRLLASSNFQSPLVERDVLVRVFEVVVRQNKATFEHQSSFDDTSNTWTRQSIALSLL